MVFKPLHKQGNIVDNLHSESHRVTIQHSHQKFIAVKTKFDSQLRFKLDSKLEYIVTRCTHAYDILCHTSVYVCMVYVGEVCKAGVKVVCC